MRRGNFLPLRICALVSSWVLIAPNLCGQERCQTDDVRISNIGPALQVAACRSSEFLDGVPNLPPGQQISYVDVSFKQSTQVFRGEERRIVDVRETAVASAEWARAELAKVVASNIPNDSCDAISAGGIAYSIVERSLVADFDVHYQKRTCTDSTCFKGWGSKWGIPYPIFEHCVAKVDVSGASATLAVRVTVTPQLESLPNGDSNIKVLIVPTTGVKDGPSELLKNIVGALTFGIGSKAIQDQFEHAVGDFRSSLSPELRTVAQLKLPQARQQTIEVEFAPEQPYFFQSGSQLAMALSRVAHVQPSIACAVRKEAFQAAKFFESCVKPQRQYVVQANDSLWKIAQNIYGEGQFYQLVRQRNRLGDHADQLTPGETLQVTPYFEIQGPNEVVISAGDTLWALAKKKLGNPLLYPQLIQKNQNEVDDPNRLITIVALKTK